MACTCGAAHQGDKIRRAVKPGLTVRDRVIVVCDTRACEIDVRKLRARRVENAVVIPLDEVWLAARFERDLSLLHFDFVGVDGFRASRHAAHPMPGALLRRGYLHKRGFNLTWDPTLDVECAYRVKVMTMMIAVAAE
jgi:hypothetical protein